MLSCKIQFFFVFWIAASVADATAVNSNGKKTYLANDVSNVFINSKAIVINELRKLRNPPSWLVIYLVVSFNKFPLFSKDLITLIISFMSLLVNVIPKPEIVLPIALNDASKAS